MNPVESGSLAREKTDEFPAAVRYAMSAATGLLAAWLILAASLGDVLLAYGRIGDALAWPGNRVQIAAIALPSHGAGPATPASLGLATDALRTTAISGASLVHFGLESLRGGDQGKYERLIAIAGLTGWHDQFVQRAAYNAAIARGDAAQASRHADALLRRGKAGRELFASLDRGLAIPEFRRAMLPYFAGSSAWPDTYLMTHAIRLDDGLLLELLAARTSGGRKLEPQVAVSLIAGLLGSGRLETVVRVWRLAGGKAGQGLLPWVNDEGSLRATAFDWSLDDGYRIDLAGNVLIADDPLAGARVTRLIALKPGSWRFLPQGDASGWSWAAGCADMPAGSFKPLGKDVEIQAQQACPVYRLVLKAGFDQDFPVPPLAPVRLEMAD